LPGSCRKHWKECGLFSTDWEKVEEIHKAYGEKRSWPDSSVREKKWRAKQRKATLTYLDPAMVEALKAEAKRKNKPVWIFRGKEARLVALWLNEAALNGHIINRRDTFFLLSLRSLRQSLFYKVGKYSSLKTVSFAFLWKVNLRYQF